MKIALAIGAALLALLWTVFIAVCAALADWIAGQGGQLPGGVMVLAQWPMPPWVALLVDPAMAETIRASVIWSLEVITALMPWIVPLLEWIAPLLWVIWGFGMIALVVLAGIGLFVVGRLRRRTRPVSYA